MATAAQCLARGFERGLLDISRIGGCHTPLTLVFSPLKMGLMTLPSIAGLVTATYALKWLHHSDAGGDVRL